MRLELQNVTKKYRDSTAVDHVNYVFTEGIYGILGANGAGKSTLMKMLSTILTPTGGSITWLGNNIFEEKTNYRSDIGILPQNFGYYDEFTVWQFLEFIASIKGISSKDKSERMEYVLKATNLQKKSSIKMKDLSGGMVQRVGIAQALINDPKILILDEPTVGLDPEERVRFRNIISSLGRKKIVILSTHIVQDVEYVADKLIILKKGKILHEGEIERVLNIINGKVWETENLPTDNVIVCNTRYDNGKFIYRIISDELTNKSAKAVRPCLDDLYLYYFHGEDRSDEQDVKNRVE